MVFSSILFLYYFLPLFLLVYLAVPKKFRNEIALGGSILFYAWGSPQFLLVLFTAATLDHVLIRFGLKTGNPKRNNLVLTLGIIANFLLLGYFKYANFFIENFNSVLIALGAENLNWTSVALPIGISFFTFQKVSFLIDTYRNEDTPKLSFKNYLLFVFFFPQLIAGPIIRFKEISDQIISREESYKLRIEGFNRFCFGLAKKILVADAFAEYANQAFSANEPGFLMAWIGALAYTFQIYFDFAGYSDMAIGLGKIMGFKFPENFNFPYASRSITEFWRRWHITLSSWMKDYLYIPLGGNRRNERRTFINLWLVFLFSGLWHGAGWNFILWGGYHGFWLILERIGLKSVLSKLGWGSQLITFSIVLFGWIFFRAESFNQATLYVMNMVDFTTETSLVLDKRFIAMSSIALLTLLVPHLSLESRLNNLFEFHTKRKMILTSFISLVLLIYSTGEMAGSGFSPFIYFRF